MIPDVNRNSRPSNASLWLALGIAGLNLCPPISTADEIQPRRIAAGAYPSMAVDGAGDVHLVYVRGGQLRYRLGERGGRINVRLPDGWCDEVRLPSLTGQPAGFVSLAAPRGESFIGAVWEEGASVNNDLLAGESDILFASISAEQIAAPVPRLDPPAKPSPPPAQAGQWARFEAAVMNEKQYRDPYRDVTLEVTYARPDGSTIVHWGFYDGSSVWRLRCLPDQLGQWRYRARFSDGAPGLEGAFDCVPSDLPGLIGANETNPIWFGFKGGAQTLIRGLHVGDRFFAANWPGEQRQRFLDWAQQQGYNLLSVASHLLNRDTAGRGAGWQTPRLWPPDATEFRRLETMLDELAERRIVVFPFAGFFGRDSGFPRDAAEQAHYLRYTLARLGSYWNLLLSVAGPEPLLKNRVYLGFDEINRLGAEIHKANVFGHLLTVHNATGDDAFRDQSWLTYGTLQGPKTVDLARLSRGLLKNHHPAKPLLAQETLWSGNVNHIRSLRGRDYTDDELRKNAWVIHLSAAALVFADNGGGNSSDGFSGTLDAADAAQERHDVVRRVWELAAQFEFHRMSPRPDLVDAGYCLAEPGRQYLVYLPSPGTVTLKLEGGPYRVEWINPRQPADRRAGETTDGRLASPSDGDDWLAHLTP